MCEYKLEFVKKMCESFQWKEVVLTLVVFLVGCQDLTFGVWRTGWPAHFLETINSVTLPSIDDDTTRMARVGGIGQIERGTASLLLVMYRCLLWEKREHFNGANYQAMLFVNSIGKICEYVVNEQTLGWETFGETKGAPLDRYFLFIRALLTSLAFVLSIKTYEKEWKFVLG